MKRFLIFCAVLLSVVGCSAPASRPAPTVNVAVLDESLQVYATAWQTEVARRFPNAEVILCHGGELVGGEWVVKVQDYDQPLMRISEVVKHFQDKFPGKTIVILSCNPGHLTFHASGEVYYSPASVWCMPDRAVTPGEFSDRMTLDGEEPGSPSGTRWQADPEVVGNIFEFNKAE